MDEMRREQLREYWNKEALYGDDWRDDLTPEELDFVSDLDRNYDRVVLAAASVILVREQVRARFAPQEILELETVCDHCRLRLRDGRIFLARLDKDGGLKLDEIDEVC